MHSDEDKKEITPSTSVPNERDAKMEDKPRGKKGGRAQSVTEEDRSMSQDEFADVEEF